MVSDLVHHKSVGLETPGYQERWQKCSPSHSPSSVSSLGWLGRPQLNQGLENVIPIYDRSWKEDQSSCWPVSLTLESRKIILCAVIQHIQDNQVIRLSQNEFTKGTNPAWLTWCLSTTRLTHLVDEWKAVGVVQADLSKVSDTISHNILLKKWLFMAWMNVCCAGL